MIAPPPSFLFACRRIISGYVGGLPVAGADSWCFRTDRDQAREEGTKYTAVKANPSRTAGTSSRSRRRRAS